MWKRNDTFSYSRNGDAVHNAGIQIRPNYFSMKSEDGR